MESSLTKNLPLKEKWLVVTRRSLADDRTLEPKASPDAPGQDARYRHHYYLTPTDGGKVAIKCAHTAAATA
jgi:hypothetical protein